MKKIANQTKLNEEVSDAEKAQARKAIILFKRTAKKLILAKDYLDILNTPFKDNPDIPPDQIMKFRVHIRKFRNESIDNFNEFKISAFKCIVVMQFFSSDSDINKLIKSFITSIEDLESLVNDYVETFKKLDSKDFVKDVTDLIAKIEKQCDEILDLVNERIIDKITKDVLSKTWTDSISEQLKIQIKEKEPLLPSLYKKHKV